MYFYPNECYVCEATYSLKQCGGCGMVSYCGEPHQKVDWKNHKTFCRAISTLLKKNHQSHIFENLKGLTRHKWMDESKKLWPEILSPLNRAFFPNEEEMLQFPRVCFVCFEARQNYLKNCPNCPFASFCKQHPSSPIHDKDCHEIKIVHDKKVLVVPSEERIQLNILVASLKKSEKPPSSMEDLMEQQFGTQTNIEENVKYYVSEAMSVPLTLYNAFQKLNPSLQSSEIVVHVQGVANVHVFIQSWESILHLMPNIISLTIVFIDSQQNSCTNVELCNKCVLAKKKLIVEVPTLPYVKYVKKKTCRKPNLLAMFMMDLYYCTRDEFRMWHENLDYWNTSSCPIVIAYKGNVERFVIENLHPYICNSSLYYMGLNSFSPLYPCLNPYDWTCCKNSMNLIIAKSPSESRTRDMNLIDGTTLENYQDEDDVDDPDNSIEWKKRLWRRSFYHSVCYVCQSMNPTLSCKKCKMIFYCGENHRRVHWPYHKVICRAMLGMLNETGATSVFDQLPTDNDAQWLEGKLNLLKRTELKIGKELSDGEREMFLFPKTCFICHANDLSILKNCKCGISFCKIHLRNANHKEQCKDFSLSRKLMLNLEPRVMHLNVKVLPRKCNLFPDTIEGFIKNCIKFNTEDFNIPNIQNILLSDCLSRTLTFLYCADRLMDPCYFENDSLVIHVIGATMREKNEDIYWKFVLYWFNHLKNLKVIFIGPEVETKVPETQQTLVANFDFTSISYMRYQNLEIKSYKMKYEDYYVHDEFIDPEIVIAFNLNIHESDAETWKPLAHVLTKVDCQFIMTAKSKARSFKDDNAMEDILFSMDYHTMTYGNELNPFASLIPERDHETEGLCYSNKCITFCTLLEKRYKPSGHTIHELEARMEMHRVRIEKMIRDKKRADKKAKNAKKTETSPMKKQKTEVKTPSLDTMPRLVSNDESSITKPDQESRGKKSTETDKKIEETSSKVELKIEMEKLTETSELESKKSLDEKVKIKSETEIRTIMKIDDSIVNNYISVSGKFRENSLIETKDKNYDDLQTEEEVEIQGKFEWKMPEIQDDKSDRIIRKAIRRIVRVDEKEEKKETTLNGENCSIEEETGKLKEEKENLVGISKEDKEAKENKEGQLKEDKEEKENKGNLKEEKLEEAKENEGNLKEEKLKEAKEEEGKLKEDKEAKEKLKEQKENKEAKEEEEEGKLKEQKLKEAKEKEGNLEKTKEEQGKLKEDKEAEGNKEGRLKEDKEAKEKEGKLKEDKEVKGYKGQLKEDKEAKEKCKEQKENEGAKEKENFKEEKLKEAKEEEGNFKEDKDKEGKLKEEDNIVQEMKKKEEQEGKKDKEGKLKEENQKAKKCLNAFLENFCLQLTEGKNIPVEEILKIQTKIEATSIKETKSEKIEEARKEEEEQQKQEQEKRQSENVSIITENFKTNKKLKVKNENQIIVIENIKTEEKAETSKAKNIPLGSKKSKNRKQTKSENESTIIENNETTKIKEIEKPEKIDGKKSKNKKPSKYEIKEREITTEEELNNEKEENLKTLENDQSTSKKSKNKKSKIDPKEREIIAQEEIIKTENGTGTVSKKSKTKKQTKSEKEIIDEINNKEECKETVKKGEISLNEKVETKKIKSKKQQKIDTKKGLNENNEEKIEEPLKCENTKKAKNKNSIKTETENAQQNDNTLLHERNKLLEEHLFLMRENEKLKIENSRLRKEGERLRRENNEIVTDDNDDLINKQISL